MKERYYKNMKLLQIIITNMRNNEIDGILLRYPIIFRYYVSDIYICIYIYMSIVKEDL
jgi:hypothetical protein